jgi:hypothetical protein
MEDATIATNGRKRADVMGLPGLQLAPLARRDETGVAKQRLIKRARNAGQVHMVSEL